MPRESGAYPCTLGTAVGPVGSTTSATSATSTPTLHRFAHVCQRPHTSYVPDKNPKRQGFCACDAAAVCIGTWCEVVPNPDAEIAESAEGTSCDATAAIPARPSCRSRCGNIEINLGPFLTRFAAL